MATHPCKDSEMSRTLKAERPRFGLTWQQNLIYTFSCGSIVSCHVCTTRAVRLCGLALLRSLYRDIGLHVPPQRAGDILPCAKHKRHFLKGGGIRFSFFFNRNVKEEKSFRVRRRQTPRCGAYGLVIFFHFPTAIHL